MRLLRLSDPAQPPVYTEDDSVRLQPGQHELLIRVHAAGVMRTELGWYPTSHTKNGQRRNCAVPGHEFAGIVTSVGEDVGGLELGREVFGMNDWFSDGAMAEYCIAPFFAVAPKPQCLTYAEAASVPISALTAWQGLFDHAKLQSGERVLVHGGAGAVGVFAIQLARLHGAHVLATASAKNADFVKSLGAERVIDYHASRFEDQAAGVDVVFDTVGGETLARSWAVLSGKGRLVTVVSSEQHSADPRVQQAFFIVEPNQKQLYEIAGLLESGRIRTVVDTVVPLSLAPGAYAGDQPRLGRGKLVVDVAGVDHHGADTPRHLS